MPKNRAQNRKPRNTSQLDERDTPPAPKDFSAEAIASIAAKLLRGDDYKAAVTRALQLLDTAEKMRQVRQNLHELTHPSKLIHLTEAVGTITGLTNEEYARETYREFLAEVVVPLTLARDERMVFAGFSVEGVTEPVAEKGEDEVDPWEMADEFISIQKKAGLSPLLVETWRRLFLEFQPKKNGPKRRFVPHVR